ncbi:MAG: hypothetical protein L6R41_001871 [Letrouitia leprolyta]|nr:MAG: hypothetical protein L6R41_001871 [Letrouitia leprolyta]
MRFAQPKDQSILYLLEEFRSISVPGTNPASKTPVKARHIARPPRFWENPWHTVQRLGVVMSEHIGRYFEEDIWYREGKQGNIEAVALFRNAQRFLQASNLRNSKVRPVDERDEKKQTKNK